MYQPSMFDKKDDYSRVQEIEEAMDEAFERFGYWEEDERKLKASIVAGIYKAIAEESPYKEKADYVIQKHQRLFAYVLTKLGEDTLFL